MTVPLGGFLTFGTYRDFDITPDGRQFVVVVPANEEPMTSRQRIHVVLNWLEELKERVPN